MQQGPEPDPFAQGRFGPELRQLASQRLRRGEELVDWAPGWVSTDGRFNAILAARTWDLMVLTNRRVLLFSTGFFTRRPIRRVWAGRLDEMEAKSVPRRKGTAVVVTSFVYKPLRFEFGADEQCDRFVAAFLAAVARERQKRHDQDAQRW